MGFRLTLSAAGGFSIARHQAQAPAARLFASDAGMILNTIKVDKTADFEAVVAKLKEALQKSEKPERKQPAATWRVFRALEPGANNSVLYVFGIDPPVKDADYTVSRDPVRGIPDRGAGALQAVQQCVLRAARRWSI